MKREDISHAVEDIDAEYVQEIYETATAKRKRPSWLKWGALAACLCLVVGLLYQSLRPTDFYSMVTSGEVDSTLTITDVMIDGWTAQYTQLNVESFELERYVGDMYAVEESRTWYYPTDSTNLKYLILKTPDGSFSLWSFASFYMEDGETHTYGDILRIIYGVDGADDIASITTSPSKSNNTDFGITIQKAVGTHRYTDRKDLEIFFNVVKDVVCYGTDSESKADNTRFTYSFSTDSFDKLTSGESTYGTRCIKIEFKNGIILDTWRYSALSGSFYEYGGIFTEPLTDEAVYKLNDIFGIY